MNAWQLDVIKDQIDTEAWNKLNAPDPYEKKLMEASVDLKSAEITLDSCMNYIESALSLMIDTPMEAKIGSYLDEVENIWWDIKKLAEAYGKGERECERF